MGQGLKSAISFIQQNPIKSVGTKLFFTFFFSILFFVIVVGSLSYNISKSVIQDKVSESSKQTIVQAVEKLDLIFGNYEQITLQLASDVAFSDLLDQLNVLGKGTYEYSEALKQVDARFYTLATDKAIQSINLIDKSGNMLYRSGPTYTKSTADQAWFKAAMDGKGKVVWYGAQKNGYFDIPNANALVIARALKDRGGISISAVLVLELKADALTTQLANVKMGESGDKFMVDPQNKIVQAENKDLLETNSKIQLQADNAKGIATEEDVNGVEQLVVFHRSQKTGWFLVGTVPLKELLAAASKISFITFIMSAIATVVAILIGYAVVRMIARPLVSLRNLMKQGEQGNLSVRSSIESHDEIGQLAQSFNQMMEQITNLVRQTNQSAQEVLATSGELSDASKKTAISAKEIAVATEEIASGASSLAIEAERGNDITLTIGDQMDTVVTTNQEMEVSAAQVQKASEQGTVYMSELITKTNATEEMTRSMIEKVDKLKESTRSIRKILDVLNNMTKQTNILSLNATIEAARAGAAGKGFMVVADEIRKLADQSKQSIDVVAQITETIQSEIDETVGVLSTAYPIFQEQISSVKEADTIFKQVQGNMTGFIDKLSEVSESIHQLGDSQNVLSEAMSNVSAVAQQSSATSEEVASLSSEQSNISDSLVRLSEKLEQLSNTLKDSLTKFQI